MSKDIFLLRFLIAESTGLATTQIISAPFNAFPFRSPRGPLQKNCGKRRKRQIFLFAHFLPTNKFELNVQIKRDVEIQHLLPLSFYVPIMKI